MVVLIIIIVGGGRQTFFFLIYYHLASATFLTAAMIHYQPIIIYFCLFVHEVYTFIFLGTGKLSP